MFKQCWKLVAEKIASDPYTVGYIFGVLAVAIAIYWNLPMSSSTLFSSDTSFSITSTTETRIVRPDSTVQP